MLSPQGNRLTEEKVSDLTSHEHLILICGRYEGVDERVSQTVVDEEVSIGDYVLSGGEVAAMVLIETLSRQIPGVVGQWQSVEQDSFRSGLLDYPHYTRPRVVDGREVPEVLVSGDHAAIARWRMKESLRATLRKRPDLLASVTLTPQQRQLLAELEAEENSPVEIPDARSGGLRPHETGKLSH
jgi:tRNA (guanine37-N1)-methyltransferase